MPIFLGGVASSEPAAGGAVYSVDNSCRFNDDDTAYLARTPGSAGDRKSWTFSAWVKRANLSSTQYLFSAGTAATDYTAVFFDASDKLNVIRVVSSSTDAQKVTTAVYRDPSAWYHVVVKMDAANTNLDVYVNGSEVTALDTTDEPSNIDGAENNAVLHEIGRRSYTPTGTYFDGYMADVVLVDGSALAPTAFGTFDGNGAWIPKSVSGLTYGTNGFHLDFADSADIGNDVSSNANDFTPSGLAAGDILSDTPTNNFATISSVARGTGSITFSEGNLKSTFSFVLTTSEHGATHALPNGGKWYWEQRFTGANTGGSQACTCGIQDVDTLTVGNNGNKVTSSGDYVTFYSDNNTIYISGASTAYVGHVADQASAIVGFAVDMDNGHLWVHVNGTYINGTPNFSTGGNKVASPNTDSTYLPYYAGNGGASGSWVVNFGQDSTFAGTESAGGNTDANGIGDFKYAPPADYLALCTANLGTPTIEDPSAHVDVVTYTGNGTAIGSGGNEISDLTFQPDLVWIKNRDAADQHVLTDAVRGATKYLSSDGTDIEATDTETLASFDGDGFTVGDNVQVNTNAEDYVAWCWKGSGAGSANADGTISSTVSANTTAGISIVKYAGNGTGGATVGHGLGDAPSLIIVKNLDQADSWAVYHDGNTTAPATDFLILDTTAATADDATLWNDTAPTSTVFSVGTSHQVNASTENYVAYCFAEVPGFSHFATYTANANVNGPFVWCGFRPALVICKRTSTTGNWYMFDNQRNGYNADNNELVAEDTTVEATTDRLDLLANGFKLRTTTGPNAAGTYMFIAFAERPFASALSR